MIRESVEREVAAGAVEETNAAVGACVSTREPEGRSAAILDAIQDALTDIAASLHEGRPVPRRLADLANRVENWHRDSAGRTPHTACLHGTNSLAAGLLRLARTVAQRAARNAAAVGGVETAVLDFLTLLPRVLDLLAAELDDAEMRSIPLGMCVQSEPG